VSSNNSLFVWFTSDESVQRNGFSANYEGRISGWWCPVGGLMSYLCFLFIVVSCRGANVLFVFFIYCGWWCHVGGLMSYLCFLFIVESVL
jgi:hypothetical protein